MKIIFSFDDGRSDSFVASQILNKFGFKGVFHITTGFIDGSFKTDIFGVGRKPLSINELLTMKKNGHEISSHGDRHLLEPNDFCTSIEKLKKWNLIDERSSFSVPNSSYSTDELKRFLIKCNPFLTFVRVGRNKKCYSFFNKVRFFLYKYLKLQNLYNSFNKHNLNISKCNVFYSVVIKKGSNYKSICNFINKYHHLDCVLVLMFHSVINCANDEWEYNTTDFENLCSFIFNKMHIDVTTFEDLYNE